MPQRLIFVMIFVLSLSSSWANEKFTITTFNIRFYGLHADEGREPYLQKFLKESVPTSDIIVFEEIVEVPKVKNLVPTDWDCISYDNAAPGHQHVVVCHSSRLQFMKEPTDNNYLIDEVAGPTNSLRPAVTAIVADKSGKQLFRFVGVHLKAVPDYSKLRVEQSEMIANYLSKVQNPHLPIVIAGDFNTYKAPQNRENEDDIKLILNAFNSTALEMKHISNELFTFRNSYGQGQFDQFYISNNMKATKPLKIYDVCNTTNTNGEGTMNLDYYYKNISDHCPVTAEISL